MKFIKVNGTALLLRAIVFESLLAKVSDACASIAGAEMTGNLSSCGVLTRLMSFDVRGVYHSYETKNSLIFYTEYLVGSFCPCRYFYR